MQLSYVSTNYVKCDQMKSVTGGTISAVASVTALILNESSRATLTNSSISLSAVSGETLSYEGRFPSTVDFTGIALVRVQVTITCTVGGNSIVRTIESDPIAPTRN